MGVSSKPRQERARWHRQPLAWLLIALFALTVAGCIAMIVLAARHVDEPLTDVGDRILKVPVSRPPTR